MFSDKYDKVYNSVLYDADIFQKVKDKIDQRVCNTNYCDYYVIVHDVVDAVNFFFS